MATLNITLPVGRMVQGDLYKPQTTDMYGKPLVYKSGASAGQPRSQYFIGYAIPKGGEQHWSQAAWGKLIWDAGHADSKGLAQRPDFAWKILDGDSQIPMQNNKKPADNPDFRGHWIVRLSSGYPPKLYSIQDGHLAALVDPGFIKCGYFVEANVSFDFNGDQQRPGMFANLNMVCFRQYHTVIEFGPDPESAGFGKSAVPPGGSNTPPAGLMPATPGATTTAAAPAYVPPVAAPAAVAVVPNVAFVQQAAGQVAAPPAPPAPPAPAAPVRQMTAAANGVTYEQYIGAGWNDAQLVAGGLMLP